MEQYTPKQRAQIVELYIKNSFSIVKTQRAFHKENKVKFAPTKRTIHNLYEKFRDRGNLGNVSRPNKKRTKRTNRNIARVKQSVERAPETSAVRRSSQLNISRTTLRRIMHDDLNLFPYKIQCVQQLLPLDKPRRVNYAKNGDIDWPARSPDLTPPDFFLWGYLKSKVYNNKPKTLRALKNNIRREIAKIPAEMLAKTMENAEKKAHLVVKEKGGHLKDIVFKK